MRIPEHGRPTEDVLNTLEGYRQGDIAWRGGRAFSYVYASTQEIENIGKSAYTAYLTENGLDPTAFQSVLRFETEVVAMCIDHLHGDADCVGNFTSGGTESILLAVKAARDALRAQNPECRPNMVIARTAHAAFFKAAHYFDIELRITEVDSETFRAIPENFANAIDDSTCIIVGSASGYAHGIMDPIEALGALALERCVRFHVDGCIGGFILEYFEELGAEIPLFDFRVPGVTSISMDLHKYAYCPKGASVVLHRNKELRQHQIYTCASWTGYSLANATVQSSKTGGPMAAAWAVLHHVGQDGYRAMSKDLLDAKNKVVEGIHAIPGLTVLGEPEMCLIAFKSTDADVEIFHVADLMNERGWYVQPQLSIGNSPKNIHITLMPANVPQMDDFLVDLAACVETARSSETPTIPPMLEMALGTIDFLAIDDATFEQLLSAAGLGGGGGLPNERIVINLILDKLSPEARERVLATFFNGLFTQPESAA